MFDSVRHHRQQSTSSPVPGILQARTLEWVAISFSNAWKWKVKVKLLSRVRLFTTPWTATHQAPPSMGFSREECWSGVLLPSPAVILQPHKKKTCHCFHFSPSICYEVVRSDSMIIVFWMLSFKSAFTLLFHHHQEAP